LNGGEVVNAVSLQFLQSRVIFRTEAGPAYSYRWEGEQMTENAKAVVSLLLTAISTKKRVTFYYDDAVTDYAPFTLINIID